MRLKKKTFEPEPSGYTYGIVSDLQGAWGCLYNAVIKLSSQEDVQRLIGHIHEGMSWDAVRDLERMGKALRWIARIAQQIEERDSLQPWLDELQEIYREVITDIADGTRL